MIDHTQPARVTDTLDLSALEHQLSHTTRRARQVMRQGILADSELVQIIQLVEQADRMRQSIDGIVKQQAVRETLRQAERSGVLAGDKLLRSEFFVS